VPLEIDVHRLRRFVNRCAEIRNDISHFGEQRGKVSYEEFIQEVYIKAKALSILYHSIILHEIGIDRETINEWINRRSDGSIRLVHAALIDNKVLRPQNVNTPTGMPV
jgi:hypothetical protein